MDGPQLNCRCYGVAGLTVRVQADLQITDGTFLSSIRSFEVGCQPEPDISLHHHFALPALTGRELARQVYHKAPWAIYHGQSSWAYLGILPDSQSPSPYQVALFDSGHTCGHIYHRGDDVFRAGNLHSLTLFPTDQILLARVLADRQGFYLHASGMVLDGQGFVFIGHSEAGKSTIVTLLQDRGEILCDDRIIVRRGPQGWRVYGTWSHGDVPRVSPASAPLRALLFLEKAGTNRLLPITDRRDLVRALPFFIVKPLVTADWWGKTLDLVGQATREVPAYRLQFDRSGRVGELLRQL